MTEDTGTTLADLAIANPAATRVFYAHGLDFCCNGDRSLDAACRESGVDPARVLEEIAEAAGGDEEAVDWGARPLDDLIDHILQRYHEPLRPELSRLLSMAQKVEARHEDKPSCPKGLSEHLAAMAASLTDHLEKEEQILFPMIRSGMGIQARMPIQVLTLEHDDHGESLARLRRLTNDLTPPDEACTTWSALYLGLRELERETMTHIHLENNVLFPRALGA